MIEVVQGKSAIVLGLPHTGTDLAGISGLNARGQAMADTDWHIHDLYADLLEGATSVRTTVHRYVIDVNRDPAGDSLYPGQNTTGLCPTTDFDGNPIYEDGAEPDPAEIIRRREQFHAAYHDALSAEIRRVKAAHGYAVLYDCHSIRSHIPFLFDGRLPDFNIGTNGGATCDTRIEALVTEVCEGAEGYSHTVNGRFKGGWTTRHYGRPKDGVHAIQMELAQSTYLTEEEAPWTYDAEKAKSLRAPLGAILAALDHWRPN